MKKFAIIFVLGLVVFGVKAQITQGVHYNIISETATEKPTVTEFFSFFCGHCFQFESMLDTYKGSLKPGTVFEKSAVDWIPRKNAPVQFGMVKAYLTIQALGLDEKLRPAIFNHIHREGELIKTEADIKAVFTTNGVKASDFDKHYNNPKLVEEAKKMVALFKEKKVTTVPTLLVNGKYQVIWDSAKSLNDLIAITNFLLDMK